MELIHFIAGPVIGAVIGYCTNWIAVKMLFHPYKPITIGKKALPLTPGIIPKRKKDLGKAIGNAIETTLLTKDDIQNTIIKSGSSAVLEVLDKKIADLLGDQKEAVSEKIEIVLTKKICSAIHNADIASLIMTKGSSAIESKFGDSFIGNFINEGIIGSMASVIGNEIDKYVDSEGYFYILSLVQQELDAMTEDSIGELLTSADISVDKQNEIVAKLLGKAIDKVMANINISQIVENKIDAMDIATLEALVMSVMKKELNSIVKLGGLIGFIIGILTVFF